MKKALIIIATILILTPVLLIGGCRQAGPTTTQEYSITDFTNVQVSSAFEIEINAGDTYSVKIIAPEKMFERITVEKVGDTLEVGTNIKFWTFWNSWGNAKLEVTMPELEILDMSGATSGTVKGFASAKDFQLNISGASHLDMDIEAYDTSIMISGASSLEGDLDAHDVRMNISGASSLELEGIINNLNLQASGASHASLDTLEGQDGRVEISGASHAAVTIENTIDVFLSGAFNAGVYG